ncbi:zinc-finger-containing protein [Robbsia sp. KACC 23696]|uniref:zinc-finger-containing protein n=1 Tax=Robbsia sp. KACC 23696 TaxID=3149231 RepID=UPI00325A85DD
MRPSQSKRPKITPSNPCPKAIARVKDPLPVPAKCPNCSGRVELVENRAIYGKPYGRWPYAYLCANRTCDSYVGIHPRTDIPLGTLANKATRAARKRAKGAFAPLWESGEMTQDDAYAWLAGALGITPVGHCHVAWFDVAMCERVVAAVEARKAVTA